MLESLFLSFFISYLSPQVGPRLKKDRDEFPPNNLLLSLVGAGILWMGWTGFNGGDPFAANVDSSIAVLNTHICTATSLLVWTCWDIIVFGKPSLIGAIQGMITGLVCITPAAGMLDQSIGLWVFEAVNGLDLGWTHPCPSPDSIYSCGVWARVHPTWTGPSGSFNSLQLLSDQDLNFKSLRPKDRIHKTQSKKTIKFSL